MIDKIKKFLNEVKSELKKVAWPNKKNVIQMTKSLIACIIIVSGYIAILDGIFSGLTTFLK